MAPARGVQLVMPQLGQPVEPRRVETVTPWWRQVDGRGTAAAAEPTPVKLPQGMPWPID
jgi:hypothetical protein